VLEELLGTKEMTLEEARNYHAGFQCYGDELNKKIEVLSGGERVRQYMVCLMLERPDCLILDEPINHLDMTSWDALESACVITSIITSWMPSLRSKPIFYV
jgi:ATP-binding cassette subfamily F protein 3